MNKKGFTLIELLAVIVILAIIALIATPLVLGVIKSSAKGAMQSDARVLLSAIDRKKVLDPDFNPTDYNGNLEGLLSEIGINSENYDTVSFSYNGKTLLVLIKGKDKYNGLTACGSYNDISVTEGVCKLDSKPPVVTLKGDAVIEVEQGGTYTDLGVNTSDEFDANPIVVMTGSVDTSTVGEYTLTYTVTDASGNIATITRLVKVIVPPDGTAPVITLNGTSTIELDLGSSFTDPGATALDNKDGSVTVSVTGSVNTSSVGDYTLTYIATDAANNTSTVTRTVSVKVFNYAGPGYIDRKGANGPVLTTGMTPVKWNGTTEVTTTINDPGWYDYTSSSKKWANVKTSDGSYWVWIPRYAYKITNNYHSSTTGTIDIKFLKSTTNTSNDGTTIIVSSDSQNNYVKHPAFTFASTEVTGIWVSKFEMSGTTSSLDSKPNAIALKNITLNSMFTATRNMETNSKYGWGLASGLSSSSGLFSTNTNNIDTHLPKSIEWGAIAYLTQSAYGKNARVSPNTNASYYVGGGSGTVYTTNVAQSTTGNIYGIYDMAGGAYEYVMANLNNTAGSAGLTPSNLDNRYIDRYTVGFSNTIYGDGIYEITSIEGYTTTWYGELAFTIESGYPWLIRGGYQADTAALVGIFNYNHATGAAFSHFSFHSILVVGSGL